MPIRCAARLERGAAELQAQDFERSFDEMLARGGTIASRLLGAERIGFLAAPA